MNKTILILSGLAVVLIAFFAFVFLFDKLHQAPQAAGTNTLPYTVPSGSSSGSQATATVTPAKTNTIRVALHNGYTVAVNDFKDDPATVKDPNNAGYYYLAGGASPALTHPPYQIFYTDSDLSFTITLYKEPIGQYRKQAEQELMQKLGTNETIMCNLNYTVATVNGLEPAYDGVNLGFSFCPGATVLP